MGYRSYPKYKRRGGSSRRRAGSYAYSRLTYLFGGAVSDIQAAFLALDDKALDELLGDYEEHHGAAAARYAKTTYPKWKSGATGLSGQTMERLVELVPPHLRPDQRYTILQSLLQHHKSGGEYKEIRINALDPGPGFAAVKQALTTMDHADVLAPIPEHVMEAAKWLFDDDITAARAMLAQAKRKENSILRAAAAREIELLRTAIASKQVKSATYSVTMPTGTLSVTVFTLSAAERCVGKVASLLFGWI